MRRIIIAVSGGIAAYKMPDLVSALKKVYDNVMVSTSSRFGSSAIDGST